MVSASSAAAPLLHSSPALTSPPRPISRASVNSGNSVHSNKGGNNNNNNNTHSPPSLEESSVPGGRLSRGNSSSHLAIRHGNDHDTPGNNNNINNNNIDDNNDTTHDDDNNSKDIRPRRHPFSLLASMYNIMSSMKVLVLVVLCLQNSMFTLLRRYSQGVKKEHYSKYEVLLLGEVIKMLFSAFMIAGEIRLQQEQRGGGTTPDKQYASSSFWERLEYLCWSSRKMIILALIYGAMNILSFVSLRNIGAGMFTIIAQCKILTTATFSTIILKQSYSWTKWRALTSLMLGVVLFSEPVWNPNSSSNLLSATQNPAGANPVLGVTAVAIEVTLSGFASIYFEKVLKVDSLQHTIWERNFQLALGSIPVYLAFITVDGGGTAGLGGGWSPLAFLVSCLGAAGGLLVALSIKYGDSILKTLATTGSIVLSSVLDHFVLGGPLTSVMCLAAGQVVISICNYTFDTTPAAPSPLSSLLMTDTKMKSSRTSDIAVKDSNDEEIAALIDMDKKQGTTAVTVV